MEKVKSEHNISVWLEPYVCSYWYATLLFISGLITTIFSPDWITFICGLMNIILGFYCYSKRKNK